MSIKAIAQKLKNPNTLLEIKLRDADFSNLYKPAVAKPVDIEFFINEIRHAKEMEKIYEQAAEMASNIAKAGLKINK